MFCVAHGSESKNGFFFTFLSLEDPTNSFIPRVNYGRENYVRLFALRMLPTVLMESSSLLKTFKCRKQIASLPTVSFLKKNKNTTYTKSLILLEQIKRINQPVITTIFQSNLSTLNILMKNVLRDVSIQAMCKLCIKSLLHSDV